MRKREMLPPFKTYEEAAEWLDSHSTAELEATDVSFEVASPLTIHILESLREEEEVLVVEQELSQKIRRIATQEGISPQVLVQEWLLEKVEKILAGQ